ncbi:preprotein translocase subunit YajC [Qipengyuania nanhaisediminis]|uniref:preprotein translocase subunit YajC n=1 Tax=Qipengyuania nanhaisediminis TaxID=604088 RepID=UPI0038B3D736
MTMLRHRKLLLAGIASIIMAAPVQAQESRADDGPGRTTTVSPYIEVSQVLSAELSPGDDVLTFTQVAAGVDINVQGRNSGVSASVRYERNIGYGDAVDTDTVSGVARGYIAVIPRAVTLEAGALASRTRVDGSGAVSPNPLVSADATSQTYALYAGPTFNAQAGPVAVSAHARIGYNRFETDDAVIDENGDPIDVFDDSVTYSSQVRAATRAGDPLPVGLAVTAGAYQEDISNLDQRVRDIYVRGDVTVPVSQSLAIVGGAGYEDVEVSSRDALRDANGDPVIGADGRLVTDTSSPRVLAFDVDGFLWDVGVLWRPSSRTSLQASIGERYDSTTYYGSFTYVPSERSALSISAYDGITGYGGALNNALAGLSDDFTVGRNPVTGDFSGLVSGADGDGNGLVNTLGSVRSAAFRGRGVNVSYQRRIGRLTAALGAGYDRRTFIAAQGTALEAADGITDESYYITGALGRQLGRNASLQTSAYVNWFEAGRADGDLTAIGASAAYNRSLTSRLSARAALAVDYFDSDFSAEDFATATALLGLRYDF